MITIQESRLSGSLDDLQRTWSLWLPIRTQEDQRAHDYVSWQFRWQRKPICMCLRSPMRTVAELAVVLPITLVATR